MPRNPDRCKRGHFLGAHVEFGPNNISFRKDGIRICLACRQIPRKARGDFVPSGPVRRVLQEWLAENEPAAERREDGKISGRYYSPYDTISDRTGLAKDTIQQHAYGRQGRPYMQFDVADSLLCAAERPNMWWQDPELAEVYESACKGADRIYPIADGEASAQPKVAA